MNKRIIRANCGFTLLELLITMSILVILVALAAPSMESTSKNSAVRAHQKDFQSALAYARGEAVARNKRVSMCPSGDAMVCDPGNDWSGGWLIFIDDGDGADFGNGIFESGEDLLRAFEYKGNNSATVTNPDDGVAINSLSWNFRGFSENDSRALVTICNPDNEVSRARGLLVERSGRVMLSRDSNDDGVHESEFEGNTNSNLSCS